MKQDFYSASEPSLVSGSDDATQLHVQCGRYPQEGVNGRHPFQLFHPHDHCVAEPCQVSHLVLRHSPPEPFLFQRGNDPFNNELAGVRSHSQPLTQLGVDGIVTIGTIWL